MGCVSQVVLQQDLQRFTARFMTSLSDAMSELITSADRPVADEALRRTLLYMSSSLDIVAGPYPEVNLMDMLVFVRLSHAVLDAHWIPRFFHDAGHGAGRVFDDAERDLWLIAERALEEPRRVDVAKSTGEWLEGHRGSVSVEWVRFDDFSQSAGSAAAERSRRAPGVFTSVRTATRAADDALLIAERAMFVVHRLPFVVRIHARMAVREILSDVFRIFRVELPLLSAVRSAAGHALDAARRRHLPRRS